MSEVPQEKSKNSFWSRIKDLPPVFMTILAFVLGLGTGALGYFFNVQLQNQRSILELRKTAYASYFEGQAKLQQARQLEAQGMTDDAAKLLGEYQLAMKQALFQIAIFSTKPVTEALAEYFRTTFKEEYGPCLGNRQQWLNDARIYQAMRQEVLGTARGQRIGDETLLILLFKCTLQ